MAWIAPPTFVPNAILTATMLNNYLRDNMLEMAAAKATLATSWIAGAGVNSIAERPNDTARISTSESTSSTSYVDLATVGPAVTLTTGTSALVFISAHMSNNTADGSCVMSWAVSGATTIAASDTWFALTELPTINRTAWCCSFEMHIGTLNAGANTFTAKYRTANVAHSASFNTRFIAVIPL